MPVWVEVIIGWMIIGAILNIVAITTLRKKGYFKWLGNLYDSEAYNRGYEDAKKGERKIDGAVYETAPNSIASSNGVTLSQVREHGIDDTRYKYE